MSTCQNCGNEISSDMMYCPKCGNKLEAMCSSMCPSCNHINNAGANYCVKCGTKLRNNLYVGNIIKFGNYFKNNDLIKEPLEWRVLEVSNNKALLISEYAIDCKPYNEENKDITWEECHLRCWLNYEFINQAFTKEEQDKILVKNLLNPDNSRWGTKGGNNTKDKIFLLSIDEANKYFKNDKDRECKPTMYAKECGAWTDHDYEYEGNCYWWLRSPGSSQDDAAIVYNYGNISGCGYSVNLSDIAVRPALFINL